MPTVQRITNTRLRDCADCKHADKTILVGETAVKQYRKGLANLYYHTDCYGAKRG